MQEFVTIPTYLIEELKNKPYSKLEACADFLSMADESREISITQRLLMERWKWGNTKVRNFIDYLIEKEICKPKTNQETSQKQTRVFTVNTELLTVAQTKNKPINKPKTNQEKDTDDKEIYKRVIDYLNNRCGTRYTDKNKQTRESIHARLEERFTEEDFYTVIDKKCGEWLGTEMERYLRPQTLFGTKFESYLNQNIVKEKGQTAQMLENHYDMVSEWARKKKMQEGFNDG